VPSGSFSRRFLWRPQSCVRADWQLLILGTGPHNNRSTTWELWVEPSNGYRIHRAYKRDNRGNVVTQVDVDYAVKDNGAISKWRKIDFRGNVVTRTSTSMVSKITLNPKVSDSDFSIKLAPRTLLFENNGARGQQAIVDENGVPQPAE